MRTVATMRYASVTSPTAPRTMPAVAMPLPVRQPPEASIRLRAIVPKRIASTEPAPPNQSSPRINATTAKGSMFGIAGVVRPDG